MLGNNLAMGKIMETDASTCETVGEGNQASHFITNVGCLGHVNT